jgi:putative FmdB family regulatory protein
MPVYEYKCNECEKTKELILSMSETDKDIDCDNCDRLMSRVFNSVPIHFKGEGFYCTDYKNDDH